jgi:predicted XRE-type DNA-binding protein
MATKFTRSSGDVFRDLGFDRKEAQDLRLRSELMIAVRERIVQRRESQSKTAELLTVSQPRISDLLRGKLHLFSVEALTEMLTRLGARVDVFVRDRAEPLPSIGGFLYSDSDVTAAGTSPIAMSTTATAGAPAELLSAFYGYALAPPPNTLLSATDIVQSQTTSATTQIALAA